jgi:hypothetical protein
VPGLAWNEISEISYSSVAPGGTCVRVSENERERENERKREGGRERERGRERKREREKERKREREREVCVCERVSGERFAVACV